MPPPARQELFIFAFTGREMVPKGLVLWPLRLMRGGWALASAWWRRTFIDVKDSLCKESCFILKSKPTRTPCPALWVALKGTPLARGISNME
jgi:hypothetical protein